MIDLWILLRSWIPIVKRPPGSGSAWKNADLQPKLVGNNGRNSKSFETPFFIDISAKNVYTTNLQNLSIFKSMIRISSFQCRSGSRRTFKMRIRNWIPDKPNKDNGYKTLLIIKIVCTNITVLGS